MTAMSLSAYLGRSVIAFKEQGPDRVYTWIAGALVVAVSLSALLLPLPTMQWFSDYWEHASAIRALAENPLQPQNPHYASADSSRQFMPLFLLLALVVRILDVSVFTALGLGAVLTVILFVYALKRFLTTYFDSPWAAPLGLLVFLFAWGSPWVWPGFYELRAHFYNNYYPSAFVFALTFLLWATTVKSVHANRVGISSLSIVALLAALMFVTHQLGGMFAIGAAMCFVLFEPGANKKLRAALAAALIAGTLLTAAWPYFNPIALLGLASERSNEGHVDFYRAVPVLGLLGPALFGLVGLVLMMRRRMHLALVIGTTGILAGYLIGGMAEHPVTHRLLSYLVVYLHLGLTWLLLQMFFPGKASSREFNRTRALVLAVSVICIGLHSAFAGADFVRVGYERLTGRSFGVFPNHPVQDTLTQITTHLHPGAIIFATPDPAMAITAFEGKVIAFPRPQLMITDGRERTADSRTFFSLHTDRREREALLEKYGATHILFRRNEIEPAIESELLKLGKKIVEIDDVVLIAAHRAPGGVTEHRVLSPRVAADVKPLRRLPRLDAHKSAA